jgi:hypothetical protein
MGLGISAAYIEPIVEELINYDFMARIGDKVYTTFIIFNQQDRYKAYDYEKSLAKQYAKKMWEDLECHLERIRQQDFYKRMNKKQQASLIQFAAIFIIQQATRKIFNEKFFHSNKKPYICVRYRRLLPNMHLVGYINLIN